ncbi:MAG: hypothetical protein F4057_11200 [Acidobacteria bacterium]|nr:hypothetical protein [Acidobacteriota bacterium]MYI75837.1 hypothetical protein [Acidobacteriota bacterium]
MEKKQLAMGFGGLLALAAVGVLLASGPREATQRVVYINGVMLLFVSAAVGSRETCDADGPCRVRPAAPWPTLAMFRTVLACAAAGWLSTSLLVSDIPWQTWLAAFTGLLVLGCVLLCLRWRFESMAPQALAGAAFIAFTHFI